MPHRRAGVAQSNLVRQRTSVQASFSPRSKDSLGFFARRILGTMDLAMNENDGINPLTATYAVPIK